MKSEKYLLLLINIVEKDRVYNIESKVEKKNRDKIVEISTKFKTRYLFKLKLRNLFRSKKSLKF